MIGRTLIHYVIEEKLGAGGMGDVYRARDTKLQRSVAIKVLPQDVANDVDRRARFEREALAVAALNHPNIVTIHAVESFEGVHFLVMELVEGRDFRDLVVEGGLPIEQFFDLAVSLADAMRAAHEQGITHRDLKPGNLMLDGEGRLRVLDFGLARLTSEAPSQGDDRTVALSHETTIGQIVGTAAYMSPEQAEGKQVDTRSDIFSMGVVLYEMATGTRPFEGDTHISTLTSVLRDDPDPVSVRRASLPNHLSRIVHRCLEKDPSQRYQTANDLRLELEGLRREVVSGSRSGSVASSSMYGDTGGSSTSSRAPSGSLGWIRWVILAGVIVVVTVVLVNSWQRDETRPSVAEQATVPTASQESEPEHKMAVVLPFENLGEPDDEYFALGMTDEITSRLSTVSGLGVISRTTATQYERGGKTVRDIGADLGVQYLLEGTVRWAKAVAERVRITARLVRVADDTQLWAQTFDREIHDVFAIQSEIAEQVAEELGVRLLVKEREAIEQRPTQNLEAYQAYLRATGRVGGKELSADRFVVEQLTKAVELDPNFVEAWAKLVRHHANMYFSPIDRTDSRLARAKAGVDRLVEIAPGHPLTLHAEGSYYYYGLAEYEKALEKFEAAMALSPNDSDLRASVGFIYRRLGEWELAAENLEVAVQLDPRNNSPIRALASLYEARRQFDRAIPLFEKIVNLGLGSSQACYDLSRAHVAARGDLARARTVLDECPPSEDFFYFVARSWLSMLERDYDAGVRWAESVPVDSPALISARSFFYAWVLTFTGRDEESRVALEEAERQLVAVAEVAPKNAAIRIWLGITYGLLGREDDALREARLGVELQKDDLLDGPTAEISLAETLAHLGREEEAIDVLERLLSTVHAYPVTKWLLRLEPRWDSLREHPRFQELVARP